MGRKTKNEGVKRETPHTFKSTQAEADLIDRVCESHRLSKSEMIRKLFNDAEKSLIRRGEFIAEHKAYQLLSPEAQRSFNLARLKAEKAVLEAELQTAYVKLAEYNALINEWSNSLHPQQLTGAKVDGY